jgi:hypothetical protein
MRTSALLVAVLAACSGAPRSEPSLSHQGVGAPQAAAPCFPERDTVSAQELWATAMAKDGSLGTCRADGDANPAATEPVPIVDAAGAVVATVTACGILVRVPGFWNAFDHVGAPIGEIGKPIDELPEGLVCRPGESDARTCAYRDGSLDPATWYLVEEGIVRGVGVAMCE